MKRTRTIATIAMSLAVFAPGLASTAGAETGSADVSSSLQTIQRDAADIAAGRYTTKAALQAPAREIALLWAKTVPTLMNDGSARVETKIANDTIAMLERDWQTVPKARSDAKDVGARIADVIDAVKETPAKP